MSSGVLFARWLVHVRSALARLTRDMAAVETTAAHDTHTMRKGMGTRPKVTVCAASQKGSWKLTDLGAASSRRALTWSGFPSRIAWLEKKMHIKGGMSKHWSEKTLATMARAGLSPAYHTSNRLRPARVP